LESETYPSRIFGGYQYMSPKMHADLDLLLIALGSPLKCVAVDEVISGMQIVAPSGRSLSSRYYRRPTDKDKKTSGDSDNQSRAWTGAMQSLLALDEEASP